MSTIDPQDVVVPAPLVTWEEAVAAYSPTTKVTRQRYRVHRKNDRITGGVQAFKRAGARASGSRTYHSALVVLAAHAARADDQELAAELISRAAEVERTFEPQIKLFFAEHDLVELPTADFYRPLLQATASALDLVPSWKDTLYAAGRIASIEGGWAEIAAVTATGASVLMDVPTEMTKALRVSFGEPVLVFRDLLKSSAAVIVELVPAARLSPDAREDAGYARYVESVDPRRAPEEVERIRALAASGSIGRRTLRPAG